MVIQALLVGLDYLILGRRRYTFIDFGFYHIYSRPDFVKSAVDKFHYLHFSAFSLLLSGCVGILVSLLTPPIPEERLYRLTFWTR